MQAILKVRRRRTLLLELEVHFCIRLRSPNMAFVGNGWNSFRVAAFSPLLNFALSLSAPLFNMWRAGEKRIGTHMCGRGRLRGGEKTSWRLISLFLFLRGSHFFPRTSGISYVDGIWSISQQPKGLLLTLLGRNARMVLKSKQLLFVPFRSNKRTIRRRPWMTRYKPTKDRDERFFQAPVTSERRTVPLR